MRRAWRLRRISKIIIGFGERSANIPVSRPESRLSRRLLKPSAAPCRRSQAHRTAGTRQSTRMEITTHYYYRFRRTERKHTCLDVGESAFEKAVETVSGTMSAQPSASDSGNQDGSAVSVARKGSIGASGPCTGKKASWRLSA